MVYLRVIFPDDEMDSITLVRLQFARAIAMPIISQLPAQQLPNSGQGSYRQEVRIYTTSCVVQELSYQILCMRALDEPLISHEPRVTVARKNHWPNCIGYVSQVIHRLARQGWKTLWQEGVRRRRQISLRRGAETIQKSRQVGRAELAVTRFIDASRRQTCVCYHAVLTIPPLYRIHTRS
jgi:hypothetical protein